MSNYSDSHLDSTNENTSWYKTLNIIKDGSSVLDIGCSSGNFGDALIKEKNCIVDGIEIADDDIASARKKLRTIYKIDIELDDMDVHIKDRYDYIIFGDVLEHLKDPIQALVRVRKYLNKSGGIVFSIPNMAHMSVRLMFLDGTFSYGETGLLDKTHVHFFDLKEVNRVFAEAGYSLESLNCTYSDYPQDLADRTLNKIGLKSTRQFRELLKSPEATCYQFVGLARPASKSNKISLPKVSPSDEIGKYVDQLRHNFDGLEAYSKKLEKELQDINEKHDQAQKKPGKFALETYRERMNSKKPNRNDK